MSDKELEEYINKIEPNFDIHLEKGTIEMSNEYYNLLEEKMVRLINKNQELKKQQKEFIDWLENEKNIYPYDISDYTYEDIINTVLSKYYEIIEKWEKGE